MVRIAARVTILQPREHLSGHGRGCRGHSGKSPLVSQGDALDLLANQVEVGGAPCRQGPQAS